MIVPILAALVVTPAVGYAIARWLGFGVCIRCGRLCAPWQLACTECRS